MLHDFVECVVSPKKVHVCTCSSVLVRSRFVRLVCVCFRVCVFVCACPKGNSVGFGYVRANKWRLGFYILADYIDCVSVYIDSRRGTSTKWMYICMRMYESCDELLLMCCLSE